MVEVVHATIPAEGTEGQVGYAEWAAPHTVTGLVIADVGGLQTALDAKAGLVHAEPLTDGLGGFIFDGTDIVVVVGVPN